MLSFITTKIEYSNKIEKRKEKIKNNVKRDQMPVKNIKMSKKWKEK